MSTTLEERHLLWKSATEKLLEDMSYMADTYMNETSIYYNYMKETISGIPNMTECNDIELDRCGEMVAELMTPMIFLLQLQCDSDCNNVTDILLSHSKHNDTSSLYQFPIYYLVLYAIVCAIGIAGNLLVLVVLIRNKGMRNSMTLFILNISVSDLLFLLGNIPLSQYHYYNKYPLKEEAFFYGEKRLLTRSLSLSWDFLCKGSIYFQFLLMSGSVLSLSIVSMERYYVVCRPLQSLSVCTKRRAKILILMTWIIGVIVSGPVLWIAQHMQVFTFEMNENPLREVHTCFRKVEGLWPYFYLLGFDVIFLYLPLIFNIIVFSLIARQILSDRFKDERNEKQMKDRQHVVTLLAILVILSLLCLLPRKVIFIWTLIAPEEDVLAILGTHENYYTLAHITELFYYINSSLNPIMFTFMSKRFRTEVRKMICLKICRKQLSLEEIAPPTSTETITMS